MPWWRPWYHDHYPESRFLWGIVRCVWAFVSSVIEEVRHQRDRRRERKRRRSGHDT